MEIRKGRIGGVRTSRAIAFVVALVTTALVTTSTALVFTAAAAGTGAQVVATGPAGVPAVIRNI